MVWNETTWDKNKRISERCESELTDDEWELGKPVVRSTQ